MPDNNSQKAETPRRLSKVYDRGRNETHYTLWLGAFTLRLEIQHDFGAVSLILCFR